MKTETLGEPRKPAAQAASARTASMFHCSPKKNASAGLPGLSSASEATRVAPLTRGTTSATDWSASTAWIPFRPASVAGADPCSPLTAASPVLGETQSTVPPSAVTCAAKSPGAAALKDTMWRPVPARDERFAADMAAMRGPPGAAFGPERTRTSFVQATAPAQPMTASVRADMRRAIESPEGRGEGSKHALGSSDRQEKRRRSWGDHFPTQKV